MKCSLALLFLVSLCGIVAADDPRDEAEPSAAFQQEALEYSFAALETSQKFDFLPQPLLRWSNPARNGEDGAVFIWTQNSVPKVIGTCFTYSYREEVRRKHAFNVLTSEAIVGKHRGDVMWSPAEPGLVMKVLPGAPTPAPTETQRTIQMRNLARQFRVQATLKEGIEQCRFVPQPLYRYEATDDSARSGATFAFSIGTDPEAMLVLEAHADSAGQQSWHYGFARFTFYPLEAFYINQTVWTVEQSENLTTSIFARADYQRLPYITFRAEPVLLR
jgi:hypothetical protein